jgi:predicted lipoprotein with Yx(FWY)xxD motif
MRWITGSACAAAAAMLLACGNGERTTLSEGEPGVVSEVPAAKTATTAGIGNHLTDANGRSLYMFALDTKQVSRCMDACTIAWPPFAGESSSTDAPVQHAMLGTIDRADQRRQSTYNGMPLYYYDDDKKAGDIEGQGKDEFGGRWYLVSPNGRPLAASTPADH